MIAIWQKDDINYCDSSKLKDYNQEVLQYPLSYIDVLSEDLRWTYRAHLTYFKARNTLRQLLHSPKDPVIKEEFSGLNVEEKRRGK